MTENVVARPFEIAVSVSSIGDEAELQEIVGDRGVIRVVDLSTPERVATGTTDSHAVIVAIQRLTAEHIEALGSRVEVIGRAGVGLDTIDLDAAARADVSVIHEPTYSTAEVADHSAALLLACARQVVTADRLVRSNGWVTGSTVGRVMDLRDSTLGVVGVGRIGRALIDRMLPFVGRIVVFDPHVTHVPDGVTHVPQLERLLGEADLLSIHVPLTGATHHLIGRAEIALLRKGAIVVNVSRGPVVDEAGLVEGLATGHLGGVGLDVYEVEPLPANSPLRQFENVVLTPHIASHSEGATSRLTEWMLADVLRHLERREPAHGLYAVDRRTTTVTT